MSVPSFEALKERKIGQWALAYLAGAWVLLQVVSLVSDSFGWSALWVQGLIVVVVIGFVATLVLAWYHGEQGAQRVSGPELLILAALLGVGGIGIMLVADDASPPAESPAAEAANRQAPAGAASAGSVLPTEVPITNASIAVLPFTNMSADTEDSYFSDGLTEEVLNALARIRDLRVAARTSSFAFENADVPTDSIGRALRVAHLVEGSVRRSGDRVRISAQLIDAETGFREWSETYDRQLTDIFAVQDEIGRAIAQELEVLVTAQPLAEQSTTDPEAYTLVLKGRQVIRTQGGSASGRITEAEGLFEQALARDSTYAAAWAEMANVYWRKAYYGTVPTDQVAPTWERARQTAQKALALNPDAGAAHYALSVVAQAYDQNYQAAVEHLERALDANPSDARARSLYGWSLLRLGRTQDAIAAAGRAAALDPLSPGVLNNASGVYYYVRRFAQAADLMRAALALVPEDAVRRSNLGQILVEMGQYNAAIAEAKQALRTDSTLSVARGALAYVYAKSGQEDAARRVLGQLPRTEYIARANIQLALNDTDAALDLLEQAVDARDPAVADIGMEPAWAELHDNPRFQQVVDRLGLTVIDPALPDPSD